MTGRENICYRDLLHPHVQVLLYDPPPDKTGRKGKKKIECTVCMSCTDRYGKYSSSAFETQDHVLYPKHLPP
jgi:hypothetical protein